MHESLWVAALFCLSLGGLAFASSVQALRRHRRVKSWPITPGRVVSREVLLQRTHLTAPTSVYEANVSYRYDVAGVEYTCTQLFSLSRGGSFKKAEAERFVAALPNEIQVRYNPHNFEEAFLFSSSAMVPLLLLLSGLALVFLGAGLLAAEIRAS